MENMEQKYIAQMEEIKRRVESIEKIVEVSTGPPPNRTWSFVHTVTGPNLS